MDFILNIGLARKGTHNIHPNAALHAARMLGLNVQEHQVYESDSEPTLVARVIHDRQGNGNPGTPMYAYSNLAADLAQDCIAVYNLTLDRGFLAGPQASAWGEFDSRFFLLLDGTRLANLTLPSAA